MKPPWLVLVESNTTPSGAEFPSAARRLGLEPVLLAVDPARYPWVEEQAVAAMAIDTPQTSEVERACARLERERPIAGVMSSSDRFLVVAAEAARARGLPGLPPENLEGCRDKRRQRSLLRRSRVRQPRSIAVSSPDRAVSAAVRIGLPVVVKPADGTGSTGVRRCDDMAEVAAQAGALLDARYAVGASALLGPVLVEELVSGPEVSVETFGLEVVGVTAKHLGTPPHFVEIGHDFPAPLSPELEREAARSAVFALRALGLGWGPGHTELRLTDRGATLIEVNPRLAGGNLPRLVLLTSGLDLVEATVVALSNHPGQRRPRRRDHRAAPVGGASIRFLVPSAPGLLRGVEGLEEARSTPGVVEARLGVSPGERLERTGSFRDRVGYVVAAGASVAASALAAERGLGALRLLIDEDARSDRELLVGKPF